jgi:hypothetical protein
MVASVKVTVFWDILPCHLGDISENTPETSVNFYQTTPRNFREDINKIFLGCRPCRLKIADVSKTI